MEQDDPIELAHRILTQQASDEEVARYIHWFNSMQPKGNIVPENAALKEAALLARIRSEIKTKKNRHIRKKIYIGVAAAILLTFIGFNSYFFLFKNSRQRAVHVQQIAAGIGPGGNHAVLTLANGQQVQLDQMGNGKIADQNGSAVTKDSSGSVAYHAASAMAKEAIQYNSLSTPRGGQYRLTLSDGTKVWLNAASSIRFPAAFVVSERKVDITGEVYFEVKHNAARPFIVSAGGMQVRVLGTHFDVNAYGDDGAIRTTLLRGSVKITNGKQSAVIVPGEQANVRKAATDIIVKKVDVDQMIAWTRGFLSMHDNDVHELMTQLSRWYNVDVVYRGKAPKSNLGGFINRNANLSDVLSALEAGGIHTRLEGRSIIVSPQ